LSPCLIKPLFALPEPNREQGETRYVLWNMCHGWGGGEGGTVSA